MDLFARAMVYVKGLSRSVSRDLGLAYSHLTLLRTILCSAEILTPGAFSSPEGHARRNQARSKCLCRYIA